jgi:exodeoxyribonuclease VII small subunit
MQKKPPATQPNYETAVAELETIIKQMESESLTLEESLTAYKRGVTLLKTCQQSLSEAEQQIQMLSDDNKLSSFIPD